jgi:hypothetical protein
MVIFLIKDPIINDQIGILIPMDMDIKNYQSLNAIVYGMKQ